MKKIKPAWILRILAILFIAFITLFAFDASSFVGFLIHLLPTLIFSGCLVIAWFKPKIGGILFAFAGAGTIIVFNTYRELVPFLAVSVIPIIIGVLFFTSPKH